MVVAYDLAASVGTLDNGGVSKKREAQAREEPAPHNTGNNLLSHNSGVVLPSAAESLTSVFEMGTCVSSRL